jgi:hypothetical protein
MRRAVATAAIITSLAAAGIPPPAVAAEELHFAATPRKVVANQAYEEVAWKVAGDGAGQVDYASVTLEHVATREAVYFDSDEGLYPSGILRFYDFEKPGRYRVYGEAYDPDFNEMPIADAYVTIKFAARSVLRAKRDGTLVKLTAKTKRYTGGYPRWEPHRGARIRLQRRVKGQWETIAQTRVNRTGVTVFSLRQRVTRDYRTVVAPTKRTWPTRSKVVRQ